MSVSKKVLSLVLSAVLLLSSVVAILPMTIAFAEQSGEWTYEIRNGTVTITAYAGNASSVTIPSTLNGTGVTAIGDNAFKEKTMTSVSFPSTITSIGRYAFSNCSGLKTLILPESLTNIGYAAFSNCTGLTKITINSKRITDISSSGGTFANAGKVSGAVDVVFGNSVTIIPGYLFDCGESEYARIKTVKLSDSITSIGYRSFYNCRDLSTISFDVASLSQIGENAFVNCYALPSLTFSSNSKVSTIGRYAFANCSGIKTLTLPESLTNIGYAAFSNCTGLTKITINSKRITDISSSGGTFANAGKVSGAVDVVFGNSVTMIPGYLFNCGESEYARIKTVKISGNVESIGYKAFSNCTDLTDVSIGSSVTQIGESAFSNCIALSNVSIPTNSSLTTVGRYAFSSCKKLKSVFFPMATATIAYSAFNDCASISDVYYAGSSSQWTAVKIENGNDALKKAVMHYNSSGSSTENKCTLSYDANGGSGAPSSQTVTRGSTVTISSTKPTRNEYSFKGWAEDPSATSADYTGGKTITLSADLTLYAVWEKIPTPSAKPGDINGDGDVNNKDLTRLMKYLAGDDVEVVSEVLDVNGDGSVNNNDLTRLMKYLAGADVEIY